MTITTPTTDFNYGGSYGVLFNSTNPVATITGSVGGTFSATNGLVIDSLTGEIDLSSATAGNYQVTYTPPSNWQQLGQDIENPLDDGGSNGYSVSISGDGTRQISNILWYWK